MQPRCCAHSCPSVVAAAQRRSAPDLAQAPDQGELATRADEAAAFGLAARQRTRYEAATDTIMGLSDRSTIDIVSLDRRGTDVVLSMIETRSWGDRGALLPHLQAKVST